MLLYGEPMFTEDYVKTNGVRLLNEVRILVYIRERRQILWRQFRENRSTHNQRVEKGVEQAREYGCGLRSTICQRRKGITVVLPPALD
jgi:hypothetical protein